MHSDLGAIINHCGACTTAAALLTGVPDAVVAFRQISLITGGASTI
jgi:hypothetical protein